MVKEEDDKEYARRLILEAGAAIVGFAAVSDVDPEVVTLFRNWIGQGNHAGMDYLKRHVDLKVSPESVLPGAATVISMAFSYAPGEFRDGQLPVVACYAYGDDYHDVIRKRLQPVMEKMKLRFGGEWRICIDSAPIAERYWAVKSGIGIRGRNGSVIVKGAGCYVFLAEILTTVAFVPDCVAGEDGCKNCGACVKACPQKALSEDGTVDSRRCINYLTIEHKGDWTGEMEGAMQTEAGRNSLYGCDLCLRVCPCNKDVPPTRIKEFEPRESIMSLTAAQAALLTQEEFSSLFKGSPIKRGRLAGLHRNARNILSGCQQDADSDHLEA